MPGSAGARSFMPHSVSFGAVDCGDLPRRPLRAFLGSTATRVAWMAVFEVQGCQGGLVCSRMEVGWSSGQEF